MRVSLLIRLGSIALPTLFFSSVQANDGQADDGWQHTIAVYMVGASIDGTAGIGPVEGDVDVSFSDILDNLDMGAMAAYRGEIGRWAVVADFMYLGLEQKKGGLGITGNARSRVEADQLTISVDGGYAMTEQLGLYGGLRYWDLDADITLTGGGPMGTIVSVGTSEDWVDPYVGLRYALPLGENWQLVTKGDIGGFGVGSDFSWHVTAIAAWEPINNLSLLFGVRFIDIDYEDGSGLNRFSYDVLQGGPTAGVAWSF